MAYKREKKNHGVAVLWVNGLDGLQQQKTTLGATLVGYEQETQATIHSSLRLTKIGQ